MFSLSNSCVAQKRDQAIANKLNKSIRIHGFVLILLLVFVHDNFTCKENETETICDTNQIILGIHVKQCSIINAGYEVELETIHTSCEQLFYPY